MKTILIIEDTDFISENIATTLKFEGYTTVIAEDGVFGLEAVRKNKPDLILCDVSMPRMDGFGVLKELRNMKEAGTTPFIFLTAKAEKADMRKGMELGADDYLTKPFTTVELINAVTTQLAKKEQVEQHYEEKLDELRGNITYALPHEFRTALNGILGFSDIIITATSGEEPGDDVDLSEINDMARSIKESGNRLHKVTENFLVYTQIQTIAASPEKILEIRTFSVENVGEIVRDTSNAFAQNFERRDDLHVHIEPGDVQMSSENFVKIICELLDNAFKFSKAGTPVNVVTRIEAGQYVVIISDVGRGMTVEQINNIGAYNQFARDLHEQQGAGLGLTVAKSLTEIHDGRFTIQSEVNRGTTVTLELPRAR